MKLAQQTVTYLKQLMAQSPSNADRLSVSLQKLEVAIKRVERLNALGELTNRHNPYYPLMRVVCRLELIKGWPI